MHRKRNGDLLGRDLDAAGVEAGVNDVQLNGTLRSLLEYLNHVAGLHGPYQPCKEGFLLKHGRVFEPSHLIADEERVLERQVALLDTTLDAFPRKQCFSNSQQLVTPGPDDALTYCEGYYYLRGGIPVHHAWVSLNGKVIDVTLRDRATGEPILGSFAERHYFGVTFETRFVRAEMLRRMAPWPLLEDARP